MHLKSIILRDWKAYVQARFDFPAPEGDRKIILIGAENGYGKTSLFEAIVLGLFGRDGLPLIARAPFTGAGDDRLSVSYKEFLETALHARAVEEGRTSCSVQLTFEDDNEPIELRRVWYFSSTGVLKPYDEDVQVFEGATRKAKGPSGLSGQDRLDWYRDYIARTFLPYYLAAFFMFDGERVSEFADKDMSVQVRSGIEGLLGIPVLRELAEDLRDYARAKRGPAKGGGDGNLPRLEQERDQIKVQLNAKKERIAVLEPSIAHLRNEQERITKELAGFGAGTQAQMQELVTRLSEHRKEAEAGAEQLRQLLSEDLSLALSGASLRTDTIERLRREQIREDWLTGRAQGDKGLERFLGKLDAAVGTISPNLTPDQRLALADRVRQAWDSIWHPPPVDCADSIRHAYLRGADRARTQEALAHADKLGATTIVQLLDDISSHQAAAARLQEELSRTQGIGPELDAKRQALREINTSLDKENRELGGLRNEETALTAQLDKIDKDIARLMAHMDQRQPEIRRATRALSVSSLVDELVSDAVPGQIAAVGQAMTEAHRQMYHKKDLIKQIEITPECEVRLLSYKDRDLRDLDLSAGEKQIFTQALISAIASVSGRGYPLLVDTPLGRLDRDHREGVLKHLAHRDSQVILLSTNTEVVGPYLAAIQKNVAKTFLIRHEQDGDIGRSWPVDGYFEEVNS